jgi:hypothetical protein
MTKLSEIRLVLEENGQSVYLAYRLDDIRSLEETVLPSIPKSQMAASMRY